VSLPVGAGYRVFECGPESVERGDGPRVTLVAVTQNREHAVAHRVVPRASVAESSDRLGEPVRHGLAGFAVRQSREKRVYFCRPGGHGPLTLSGGATVEM